MGCGCGKNKPKVNQTVSRNPTIVAQSTSQYQLRVNQIPRPNVTIQAQAANPNLDAQVNAQLQAQAQARLSGAQPTPPQTDLSPAGLDAHKRRIEALRREAMRRALNK
jgi:hypothetical protein